MTQLESMKMALQLNNEEIFRRIPKQNPDSSVSISHFDEVVEDLISTPVEFEFITNGITNIGKSVSLLHDIRDYKKIALTFNTFSASNNPSSFVTNEFYVSDLINDNGVFIANYFGISAPWGSESDVNVCSVYLLGEACTPTSLYINNVYNHNAISTKGKLYIKGIKTCVKEEAGTLDDIAPTIGENGNWYVMGKDTGVKAQGQDGIIGSDGKSAYELAVKNGYTGTETEWLTSLQGNPGQDGKDGINGINGIDGTNGVDGKSAYQLWLDQGNTGNETDFLESLKGKNGEPGQNGAPGENGLPGIDGKSAYQSALDNGFTGTELEWLESLKGEDGTGVSVSYFDETIENLISVPFEFTMSGNNGGTTIDKSIPLLNDIRKYKKIAFTAIMWSGSDPATNSSAILTNEFYVSDLVDNNGNFLLNTFSVNISSGGSSASKAASVIFLGKGKSTVTSLWLNSTWNYALTYNKGKIYIKGIKECVKEVKGTLDDITPKIGENGNWIVLDKDTGVKAQGEDGQPGAKGEPGQNGEPGVKGKDGQTPYIGENGNWWYGDTDSGTPGPKIEDCIKIADNTNGIQDTPVGHIIAHMGTVAPKHYLICDGTIYNIVDYPHLTKHIKDNFGSVNYFGGDGITTFAIPDLRGEFLRGTGKEGGDVGGHQAGTDIIGGYFGNSIGAIYNGKDLSYTDMPNKADSWQAATGDTYMHTTTRSESRQYPNTIGKGTSRPTNTSVLYCIKYEPTYFIQIVKPEVEYSLEEQRIGTWIDGKPIYRKIIETQLPSESLNTWYDITSLDIKNLINIKTISVNDSLSETGWMTAPLEGLNFFYLYKKSEKVYIAVMDLQNATSDGWNKPITIFLEYTKKS